MVSGKGLSGITWNYISEKSETRSFISNVGILHPDRIASSIDCIRLLILRYDVCHYGKLTFRENPTISQVKNNIVSAEEYEELLLKTNKKFIKELDILNI